MATKTKSASSELIDDDDRRRIIADWLLKNEKLFFVDEVTMNDALKKSPFPVSTVALAALIKEHCRFWQVLTCRKECVPVDLDQNGWDRVKMFATKHAAVLNEPDSTFNFCLKLLLTERVQINRRLLMNCTAFHRLTNRRFLIR